MPPSCGFTVLLLSEVVVWEVPFVTVSVLFESLELPQDVCMLLVKSAEVGEVVNVVERSVVTLFSDITTPIVGTEEAGIITSGCGSKVEREVNIKLKVSI